jgi:hypothetical protein
MDTLNVSLDAVYMPMYMVNVPHDMLKAYGNMLQVFMDMEHVSYGMLNDPHVMLKYIWT